MIAPTIGSPTMLPFLSTTYVVDKNGNIVGEPIVGAITEKNQAKTLEKLIDQALQVK